jgi:hypothetical protein
MKADDTDPLDDLLAQWRVQTEVPPDFRREVWRRIASDAPAASWVEHFAYWLLRPRREVAILLIAIGIAVAWGLTHPPATDLTPRDAYVLSISPFDPNHDSGR